MDENPSRPAMTMREIRTALGHTDPPVQVDVTRYEVSVLPADDINRKHFTLYVEYQRHWYPGGGQWSVHDGHDCFSADGVQADGITVYGRDDDWIKAHRFDLETALALARKLAPNVTVNGHTATEAYRRTHPDPATPAP